MNFPNTIFGRCISVTLALAMVNLSVPYRAFAAAENHIESAELATGKIVKRGTGGPHYFASKRLSQRELEAMTGRFGPNPYVAGTNKYIVVVSGIDLMTGNFTTSATDLAFEGGIGVPVNVTRAYSANSPDEGPFGYGWSLSTDMCTTAGGLMKSPGGAVRSVPVQLKERPSGVNQVAPWPSGGEPPLEAVVATDAAGYEEVLQKDVDGILSTPPWDKNLLETQYEIIDGYWVATAMTSTTPEGTVYEYTKQGYFDGGCYAVGDPEGDTVPSNILMIDTITDRHGNVTEFHYDDATGTFEKSTGTAVENLLEYVQMEGGRSITFTWETIPDSGGKKRITSVSDGATGDPRVVGYAYNEGGYLIGVTSPAGKETAYTYGGVTNGTYIGIQPLTTITDCRGLTTLIKYVTGKVNLPQYGVTNLQSLIAYKVIAPNGVGTYKGMIWEGSDPSDYDGDLPALGGEDFYIVNGNFWTSADGADGDIISAGSISLAVLEEGDYAPGYSVTMQDNTVVSHGFSSTLAWQKVYQMHSLDQLLDVQYIHPNRSNSLGAARKMTDSRDSQVVATETTYNFMGNPLSKEVTEYVDETPATPKVSEFAYHGASKYYQQKAARVKTGSSTWRYSYTDYFTNTDGSEGNRGQVDKVYNSAFKTFTGVSGGDWRDAITLSTGNESAEFDYDSAGRTTHVKKLQKVVSGTPSWVHTETTYGANEEPTWGAATMVVEDSEGVDRTTETTAFDNYGRPTEVTDAAGRVFATEYDKDGRIMSVTRTDGDDQLIAYYEYGTEGIANGMPVYILDGLSEVEQEIEYCDSDGGTGQVAHTYEFDDFGSTYNIYYTYNLAGERETAKYVTPSTGGTGVKWKYSDYIAAGAPENASRVFQTLNKQSYADSTWSDSSEEFWYQYDTAGRLNYAAFGLIPLEGEDDYSAELAAYRLISKYEYEPAGRIASVATISQEGEVGLLSGHVESYSKIYDIAANSNEYDAYLGLKTESQTMWWGTSGAFSQGRLQEYSYDALDQLSQCDFYNVNVYGSTSGHTVSNWYYDAAGNRYTNSDRDDHTYTNLNMMTDSPGSLDYDNDVLGNRTWREPETASAVKYVWDSVNRLTSARGHSNGAAYKYRADGMRVKKVTGYTIEWHPPEGEAGGYYDEDEDENAPTFRYFYDGQMCMEDDYLDEELEYEGRRYGLGARGVDFIQTFDEYGSQTGRIFPVYDGHGNMICTVARNGTSGYYAPTDVRDMGPWGEPRITSNSSLLPPDSGYCANLGHKEDFESGMVYMRARYYEPGTGRFISEDPARHGWNWYAYASNNPACGVDYSGQETLSERITNFSGQIAIAGMGAAIIFAILGPSYLTQCISACAMSVVCWAVYFGGRAPNELLEIGIDFAIATPILRLMVGWAADAVVGLRAASRTLAFKAVALTFSYMLVCWGALLGMEYLDDLTGSWSSGG